MTAKQQHSQDTITMPRIEHERDYAQLAVFRAENARLREALEGCITQLAQDNVSAGSRDYETALPYTLAKARAALAGGKS